ncbi:MAG: hypothetical protein RR086_02125 [Clostridia bacterium]
MIEEVINSIIEAEDVSAKKIEEATEHASDIRNNANNEADKLLRDATLELKKLSLKLTEEADKSADIKAKECYISETAKADEVIKKYARNVNLAVKYVVERVK